MRTLRDKTLCHDDARRLWAEAGGDWFRSALEFIRVCCCGTHTWRTCTEEELSKIVGAPDFDGRASKALVERLGDSPPQLLGLSLLKRNAASGVLVLLCVHPDHRRRCVGTGLVEVSLASASKNGATRMSTCGIDSRDQACDFFRARGWREEATGAMRMGRSLQGLPRVRVHPAYRIRTFQEGDERHWVRVKNAAFATEERPGAPSTLEDFRKGYFESPKYQPDRVFFAVRESDGEVAGTASAWESEFEGRRVGMVHWLAVDPAHRGKSLGRALVTRCLHYLREHGFTESQLNTSGRFRAAVRVYRECGFRTIRRSLVFSRELGSP